MKTYSRLFYILTLSLMLGGCTGTGEDVCDSEHLSLCTQESTCNEATGIWEENVCHTDNISTNSTTSNWDEMSWDNGQWK